MGNPALVLSLLSFAYTEEITELLVQPALHNHSHAVLVAVTLSTTFVMYVAINAVQVGLRALISDCYTTMEQVNANAWISFYSNLAASVGNFWAYMCDFSDTSVPQARFQKLSLVAAVCLNLGVAGTCVSTKEAPPPSKRPSQGDKLRLTGAIWKLWTSESNKMIYFYLLSNYYSLLLYYS